MFDHFRLKDVLVQYKQNFVSKQWGEEKYKWEAVKWFQDHWDVNAPDFAEMLNSALDRTYNLLASANNFPKRMIISFAKTAPEEVRAMFICLTRVRIYLNGYMRLSCSQPFSWRSMEMEPRSTISTKMPSAHISGSDIQINIISISSVR